MAKAQLKLLFVEDDEVDRESVQRSLDNAFEVENVTSIAEAIGELMTWRPDCLLVDYNLPDGHPIKLLKACQKQAIAAVVLTGEASPKFAVQALQSGAQDYLVKGRFSPEELNKSIHNAIEKSALLRDLDDKQRQLKRQSADLEKKNEELRNLASELTLAEQRERHQVSLLLHDELQQQLYAAKIALTGVTRLEAEQREEALETALSELDEALGLARELSSSLSPAVLQSEGLAEALTWLASDMQTRHALAVEVSSDADLPEVSEALRVLLFQLVRELLINVAQHSGTTTATLELGPFKKGLCISVSDRGKGFDTKALDQTLGHGLQSVRERLDLFDGTLELESHADIGTHAIIKIPVIQS